MQRRSRPSMLHFVPGVGAVEYAEKHGLNLYEERDGWLDWCEATGKIYANHQAGFRTWLRHAVQYGRGKPLPADPVVRPVSMGRYQCPLELGCDNGWVPDTYPARQCQCRRKPGTGVRDTVQCRQESDPTKKETLPEESANPTLFTNLVDYSANPTVSR